jgi:hypothetical protein
MQSSLTKFLLRSAWGVRRLKVRLREIYLLIRERVVFLIWGGGVTEALGNLWSHSKLIL